MVNNATQINGLTAGTVYEYLIPPSTAWITIGLDDIKSGTYLVENVNWVAGMQIHIRYAATARYLESPPLILDILESYVGFIQQPAIAATSTVTIDNLPAVYDKLLTASAVIQTVEPVPDLTPEDYVFTWLRNGNVPIGTGNSYTPAADDVGQQISVRVTTSKTSGSAISAAATVLRAAGPDAPIVVTGDVVPQANQIHVQGDDFEIIVTLGDGSTRLIGAYEYSIDGGTSWHTLVPSIEFDDADEYSIIIKISETQTHLESAPSIPVLVEVTAPSVPVDSVTISLSSASTIAVGRTAQLTSVVLPELANQNVTWASEDESVATVDPATGVVTGVSSGATVITATGAGGIVSTNEIIIRVMDYHPTLSWTTVEGLPGNTNIILSGSGGVGTPLMIWGCHTDETGDNMHHFVMIGALPFAVPLSDAGMSAAAPFAHLTNTQMLDRDLYILEVEEKIVRRN
jgi:hypothetical protein